MLDGSYVHEGFVPPVFLPSQMPVGANREESQRLQRLLFAQYRFTNVRGETRSLLEIFAKEKAEHAHSTEHAHEDSHACCHEESCGCGTHSHEHSSFGEKIKEALVYAFQEMMEDIGKWLMIGLIVAGLITVFVPDEAFAVFKGNTFASMLLVICIAIPMYLCATGSIPIAVALILKGLTPGAGLVLLMAGPACNMASILVVRKVLGTRTLVTYLASIIVGSICCGIFIDYLQFHGIVDFLSNLVGSAALHEEGDSWFSWACTAVLILLLINALVLPKLGLQTSPYLPLWESSKRLLRDDGTPRDPPVNCWQRGN